jgi:uncharacterized protein
VLVAASLCLASCAKQEPLPIVFVDDRAALLTDGEEDSISRYHALLLRQHDIDYRVLTVLEAPDLSSLAVERFAEAGVGGLSDTRRGLLLVVDAGRQRVRLEVSRELEGEFVDSFVAYIESEQMAPYFAAGRVGDGILATTELIVSRSQEAVTGHVVPSHPGPASSTGAGAEVSAPLDSGYRRPTARASVETTAGADPLGTVATYLGAMAAHDARPDLDVYTPGTRSMLAGHVVTRAQMDNLVRTYGKCPAPRVREHEGFAIVDHPGAGAACAPWLLARGADRLWRLDLLTMQRALRFDSRNHWHVANPEALEHYTFAFGD